MTMRAALVGVLAALSLAAGNPLEVPLLQQAKNGCGAASAAMIFHYWADRQPGLALARPSTAEVQQQLGITETRGVPLAELRRYFDERGFHAFTLRASEAELGKHMAKGRPVLVPLRERPDSDMHYVVVVGMDENKVWLNDPAKRKVTSLSAGKFDRKWAAADRWMLLAVPRAER